MNRVKYTRKVNMHHINYKVSTHHTSQGDSLVDQGANGGIAGADVRLILRNKICTGMHSSITTNNNNIVLSFLVN